MHFIITMLCSFINETALCLLGDAQRLICDLFATIFVDEIEHNQTIVFLKCKSLNIYFCIKSQIYKTDVQLPLKGVTRLSSS